MSGRPSAPACNCSLCLVLARLKREGHNPQLSTSDWGWLVERLRVCHCELQDRLDQEPAPGITSGEPPVAAGGPPASAAEGSTAAVNEAAATPPLEAVKSEEPDFEGTGLENVQEAGEKSSKTPEKDQGESTGSGKPASIEEKSVSDRKSIENEDKGSAKKKKDKKEKRTKEEKKVTREKKTVERHRKRERESNSRETERKAEKEERHQRRTDKSDSREPREKARSSGRKERKKEESEEKEERSRKVSGRPRSSSEEEDKKRKQRKKEKSASPSPRTATSSGLRLQERAQPDLRTPREPSHSPPAHIRQREHQSYQPTGWGNQYLAYPSPPGYWGGRGQYYQPSKAKGRVRRERWQDIIQCGPDQERKKQREGR